MVPNSSTSTLADAVRSIPSTHHHDKETLDVGIVSRSPALQDVLNRLDRVAPIDTTVLITGETGTGKELLARELHRRSRRAARSLVAVNLAAIPEPLVASELFGHEQGAFTGAIQRRIGRFELADRATLFLDEIGELSLDMQIALLRIIQEGEFERLGASQTRRVDVRLIAATNRSLEEAVEAHGVPGGSVSTASASFPFISRRCASAATTSLPWQNISFSGWPYGWDGGSPASSRPHSSGCRRSAGRETSASCRTSSSTARFSATSRCCAIPPALLAEKRPSVAPASKLDAALHGSEQQMIEQALAVARGRVSGPTGAAASLGIPASTLESKIKRFNIDKLRFRSQQEA